MKAALIGVHDLPSGYTAYATAVTHIDTAGIDPGGPNCEGSTNTNVPALYANRGFKWGGGAHLKLAKAVITQFDSGKEADATFAAQRVLSKCLGANILSARGLGKKAFGFRLVEHSKDGPTGDTILGESIGYYIRVGTAIVEVDEDDIFTVKPGKAAPGKPSVDAQQVLKLAKLQATKYQRVAP